MSIFAENSHDDESWNAQIIPGTADAAVVEVSNAEGRRFGSPIVIDMADGRIVSMREFKRRRSAYLAAGLRGNGRAGGI